VERVPLSLTPQLLDLIETTSISSIQALQWIKRAPDQDLQLKVKLELVFLSFFLVDYEIFRRLGPEARDAFMDELKTFVLVALSERFSERDCSRFVEAVNVYVILYAKIASSAPESPSDAVLSKFSTYLTQTIKGNALNPSHVSKVYEVVRRFKTGLDQLIDLSLDMNSA
jgi:hypothetical protein